MLTHRQTRHTTAPLSRGSYSRRTLVTPWSILMLRRHDDWRAEGNQDRRDAGFDDAKSVSTLRRIARPSYNRESRGRDGGIHGRGISCGGSHHRVASREGLAGIGSDPESEGAVAGRVRFAATRPNPIHLSSSRGWATARKGAAEERHSRNRV